VTFVICCANDFSSFPPGTKTEKKQKSFLNRRSQRSQRVTVFKSHRRHVDLRCLNLDQQRMKRHLDVISNSTDADRRRTEMIRGRSEIPVEILSDARIVAAAPSLAAFMCTRQQSELSVHPNGNHTANIRHKSVGFWKLRSTGGTQQICPSLW
jgi:hypothetical protein